MAQNRDIIVIGASAGGVDALRRLMRDLPADLPASVFVVLHVGAASQLAALLQQAGPLPAADAQSGEAITPRRVYVAPPGRHLLLHEDHVLLRRGPRENLARPAIDPLFRSAASSFGGRVIGVVLTGALNDGTAGLRAVKRCGGIAVIQDPADATVPEMPLSAQKHVAIDYCVPLSALGRLLIHLAGEPAGDTSEIPDDIRLEVAIAAQQPTGMQDEDRLGLPSRFSCPECHGTLWEIPDGDVLRYRCHVGHALTADAMLAAQNQEAEQMLWGLLRSHQERARLMHRMAEREQSAQLSEQLQGRARDYDEDAELIRKFLTSSPPRVSDPTEGGSV